MNERPSENRIPKRVRGPQEVTPDRALTLHLLRPLLLANAVGNGAGSQLLRRQRATQSADVVTVWKNVLTDVDPADPGRILFSELDGKTREANAAAISALDAFLLRNAAQVSAVFRPVRAFGMMDTGSTASYCMVDGIEPDEQAYLEKEKALTLIEGAPLAATSYGAYISYETATKTGSGPETT